jgi:hypothetical protein
MNLQLNDIVIIARIKDNKIYAKNVTSYDYTCGIVKFFAGDFQIRDHDFFTVSQDEYDCNGYKLLLVLRQDKYNDLKVVCDLTNGEEDNRETIESDELKNLKKEIAEIRDSLSKRIDNLVTFIKHQFDEEQPTMPDTIHGNTANR